LSLYIPAVLIIFDTLNSKNMNIVVLNGNPESENAAFDRYLEGYQLKLHKAGHYVKTFLLREMRIDFTTETGNSLLHGQEGFAKDDVRYILNSLQETDLLVWASPLKQGLIAVPAKRVQESVNSYFQGRHSVQASAWAKSEALNHVPLIGMILQPDSETTSQDVILNRLMQERMAANLNTVLSFYITTELSLTDAACETFRSFDYRHFIEDTCNDFLATKATVN
jgi:hypothetical protein